MSLQAKLWLYFAFPHGNKHYYVLNFHEGNKMHTQQTACYIQGWKEFYIDVS